MAPTTTSRMSLQALQRTPEFQRLSAKAKMFVSSFVGTYESFGAPDAVFATRSAYQNDAENSRKMSYAVLKNKKVADCLQVWRDSEKSKRQMFIDDVERQMNSAPEGSVKRIKLIELYSAVALFGAKIPKTHKQSKKSKRGN